MSCDISVIIPTFRRPLELREALDSVLGQGAVSVEVIVVDDSPEGSAQSVVENLGDPRVSYLRNRAPTGGVPGIVRNLGWPVARGRYIHFLDDDDLVPEGHYAVAKAAFEANPAIGVLFGRIEPFGKVDTDVERERLYFDIAARRALASRRFGPRLGFAGRLLFGNTLLVCSAGMIRRECVAAIKGFDADSRLVEDVDFYARAIRRFGVLFLDRTVLHYRISLSLIHRPDVQPIIERSYQLMHRNYRREWGLVDFMAMKLFARTVLRAP